MCNMFAVLRRSLPALSTKELNAPLPLQISWRFASLLLVHSVGLEPKKKGDSMALWSFHLILNVMSVAVIQCTLVQEHICQLVNPERFTCVMKAVPFDELGPHPA